MANVLGHKEATKSYSSKGLATIRCGNNKAKITFAPKEKQARKQEVLWDTGETSKVFTKDDLPNTFLFEPNTEADYYVCTTLDKSGVFAVGPWEGTFDMKVSDFSRPDKDSDPAPFFRSGIDKKTGKEYGGWWWKVQWKIVEECEFKNCVVIQQQVYESDTAGFTSRGDGFTQWKGYSGSDRAVWQPRLEKFCEKHNAVDQDIPWDEDSENILPDNNSNRVLVNILPIIFERVKNAPVKVHRMKVEKGEVVDFSESKTRRQITEEFGENPFDDKVVEDDDMEVEDAFPKKEEPAPKKLVKKVSKTEDEDDL